MNCLAWRPVPLLTLALLAAGCRRAEHRDAATTGAPDFRNPASAAMRVRAPATFRARFETSKGAFVIEVQREWAPLGADRFYNLVKSGYYDATRFFRVIAGVMAQFGIPGAPRLPPAGLRRPGGARRAVAVPPASGGPPAAPRTLPPRPGRPPSPRRRSARGTAPHPRGRPAASRASPAAWHTRTWRW